jgi:RNA polymerase sigma factor (TIGR02999 family)
MHDVTDLLKAWNKGDKDALEKLIPLVDKELKKVAHKYMRNERREHILQTTALVHEALIKLIKENVTWENRRQFYAIVARRMRQVLVDYARKRPKAEYVDIADVEIGEERSKELRLLDEALTKFETKYQRQATVLECRYFIGLTIKETAALLDVSESTVEHDWEFARAWLKREMTGGSVNE